MENKNIDNISDSALPVDHNEMPVDGPATPVTPVEMAVGPAPPVVLTVRPSDSSATRSDYADKRYYYYYYYYYHYYYYYNHRLSV